MKDSNKTWSSSSLASAFAHRLFYWAIRVGGRWVAYFMLHFVVGFYTCLPWVRERSQPYRLRRFGPRAFPRELVDCHRLQMEFGKMLVDRAVMGILGEFTMKASEGDRKVLSDIASCGRGLILVTGHAGCWQLGMSVLDHIDAPKAVVMYRGESDVDRHYFEHGESGPPFSIIDPCSPLGGTLEMMDVLKKGGVLCVMGDRSFGSDNNVVEVEFLGGIIKVPVSAYKLASATGATVAATFSHRTGPGIGRIWISRVMDVPEGLGRDRQAYQPYAQEFVRGLEEYTELHPLQFYNFFNMWKSTQ